MKIIYLTPGAIPSRAANGVQVMRMCNAFAQNGHQVELWTPERPEREASVDDVHGYYGVPPTFSIRPLPWHGGRGSHVGLGVRVMRAAWQERPCLVYGRFLHGCAFAAMRGLPVIYESHFPVDGMGRLAVTLFRVMIRRPSFGRLIAITEPLARHYQARFGMDSTRILVAGDAADPPPDRPSPSPLRIPPHPFTVGYVGQLYRGKGIGLIAEIASKCPWGQFHVVGGDAANLHHWVEATSDRPNITFHGFVLPRDVPAVLRQFDVLLAPYQGAVYGQGEALDIAAWMSPLKLGEYMAAGKPIVCSDLPVLRALITPDVSARVCPPQDVDAWCRALAELRDRPDLRRRLGSSARQSVTDAGTWRTRAERVLAPSPSPAPARGEERDGGSVPV